MMLVAAAAGVAPLPCSRALAAENVFPEITGGTACDEDAPTPGTCNCSGMPMGPESWRLSKPEWFGTDLESIYEADAMFMGENVSLARWQGAKATMVINIASA